MNDTITTELRKSMVDDARGLLYIGETALANLCDAIDAVHANLEAENESLRRELDRVLGEQEDRYQEGIMDGCAHYDAEHTECLLSEPHGYMELPKDADGKRVRIGDLIEWTDGSDEPFEVVGIGNGMLYYIDDDEIQWTRAETKRHHQPDTWERIIEDAKGRYSDADTAALVARCKALAGDAE